jgi:hypothetical protein
LPTAFLPYFMLVLSSYWSKPVQLKITAFLYWNQCAGRLHVEISSLQQLTYVVLVLSYCTDPCNKFLFLNASCARNCLLHLFSFFLLLWCGCGGWHMEKAFLLLWLTRSIFILWLLFGLSLSFCTKNNILSCWLC